MKRQILIALFALAAAQVTFGLSLPVEHAFDGVSFRPAGTLKGNLITGKELTWVRPELSREELELLNNAARANGFYTIRVKTAGGDLLSSVRAACLSGPAFAEEAEAHVDHSGALVSFTYSVPPCAAAAVAAVAGGGHGHGDSGKGEGSGAGSRPGGLGVRLVMPRAGPMMALDNIVGEFAEVTLDAASMGAVGGAQGAGGQAARGPGGARAPPPKDERTWLQKNWMFVAAGGLMTLNMILKANAPPQPGPPAAGGAPAGGGGGAARR